MMKRRSKRRQQRYIIIAVVAVIAIILAAYALQAKPDYYAARTPASLIDVPTINEGSNLAYHHHVHLDIYIDGKSIYMPVDVGHVQDDTVLYALHTHSDYQGIIHIESPDSRSYALGQIFEVWGWPLDSSHIFDKTGPVTLYVNNGGTPHLLDTGYQLQQGDEIVLVFGSPPATIPSSYSWPTGLP